MTPRPWSGPDRGSGQEGAAGTPPAEEDRVQDPLRLRPSAEGVA